MIQIEKISPVVYIILTCRPLLEIFKMRRILSVVIQWMAPESLEGPSLKPFFLLAIFIHFSANSSLFHT